MADFRKCVYAFAVLALLLGSAVTASAQTPSNFQCIANSGVPPLLRAEGLTELTGDIVLNCTGGAPIPGTGPNVVIPAAVAVPTVNIRIFLNTTVTSRLLSDPWSEALLMINEPPAAGPFTTCTGGTTATVNPNVVCNVIQGRVVGGNAVEFLGVPVLPPGTTGATIYRVTNLRANASAVAPGGSGTPGQVIGLISATPATFGCTAGLLAGVCPTANVVSPTFPINNPQQIIGFVQNGLAFAVRNTASDDTLSTSFAFSQCVSRSRSSSGFAVLRYSENFPTAFKVRTTQTANPTDFNVPLPVNPQNVPGFIYNTESGYYNPNLGGTLCSGASTLCAGLADFSTRLRAVFSNVPTGVRLFVTVREVAGTGNNTARLIGSEIGAFFPVTALSDLYSGGGLTASRQAAEVPLVNGSGTAVWEIMSSDPLTTGRVEFGLYAVVSPDVANNVPTAPSQATISGSFAPAPPAFSASSGASASQTLPVPRFVDLGTARNLFRISICMTNLLFPFVTNQAGFDTGLAISNTSRDPFGTGLQTGTCTLNSYGANAPAAITSPVVTPDAVYTALASTAMPNFQGYVIAQCRFQYAHGFAFVSDLGARNLAMGYLALIIPALADGTRPADNQGFVPTGTGEALGQ